MTREEAIEIVKKHGISADGTKFESALRELIPELNESEDERIRKMCITAVNIAASADGGLLHHEAKQCLDWLEKQKENPKSADSIPSDCTSDARCEDRWHKVTDSLPDNGRLVLAKDCLGNVLLARYDGENWEVNVYDNEDHYCHNSISKWCEIPSEKQKDLTTENIYKHSRERMSFWNGQQKEQKPKESISQLTVQGKGVYKICPRCKERMVRDDSMVYTSMPPQYRYECPKCGESECDTVMYDNPEMEEQKPVVTHGETYHVDTLGTQQVIAGKMPQKPAKWTLPKDFEEAVYKVANFISPFDSQEELRKVSHHFAEQLMSLAKKELDKPTERNTAMINGEPIPTENHSVNIPLAEWSEEDRKHLNSVLLSLNRPFYNMNEQEKSDFNWLYELPKRFNLQTKPEVECDNET